MSYFSQPISQAFPSIDAKAHMGAVPGFASGLFLPSGLESLNEIAGQNGAWDGVGQKIQHWASQNRQHSDAKAPQLRLNGGLYNLQAPAVPTAST